MPTVISYTTHKQELNMKRENMEISEAVKTDQPAQEQHKQKVLEHLE